MPLPGDDELMEAEDSMSGMEVPGTVTVSRSSTPHHTSITAQEHVGELGNTLLACEHTCMHILNTILRFPSATL
jgi:hypothetical protein